MRISDWSSDVCSSDLPGERSLDQRQLVGILMARPGAREKGGRCRLRAARQLGVGLFASPRLVADAAERDAAAAVRLDDRANRNQRKGIGRPRSEEHTSELQSLMRISYAVFCLQKKKKKIT